MAHAWKASQAKAGGGSTTALSGFVAAAKPAVVPVENEFSRTTTEGVDDGSGSDVASSNGDD